MSKMAINKSCGKVRKPKVLVRYVVHYKGRECAKFSIEDVDEAAFENEAKKWLAARYPGTNPSSFSWIFKTELDAVDGTYVVYLECYRCLPVDRATSEKPGVLKAQDEASVENNFCIIETENRELKTTVIELRKTVAEHNLRIGALEAENRELKVAVPELKAESGELKAAVTELKAESRQRKARSSIEVKEAIENLQQFMYTTIARHCRSLLAAVREKICGMLDRRPEISATGVSQWSSFLESVVNSYSDLETCSLTQEAVQFIRTEIPPDYKVIHEIDEDDASSAILFVRDPTKRTLFMYLFRYMYDRAA